MSKIKSNKRGRPPKPGSLAWQKQYGSQDVKKMNQELKKTNTKVNIFSVAGESWPVKNKRQKVETSQPNTSKKLNALINYDEDSSDLEEEKDEQLEEV